MSDDLNLPKLIQLVVLAGGLAAMLVQLWLMTPKRQSPQDRGWEEWKREHYPELFNNERRPRS